MTHPPYQSPGASTRSAPEFDHALTLDGGPAATTCGSDSSAATKAFRTESPDPSRKASIVSALRSNPPSPICAAPQPLRPGPYRRTRRCGLVFPALPARHTPPAPRNGASFSRRATASLWRNSAEVA
jgi:hypothetical protein